MFLHFTRRTSDLLSTTVLKSLSLNLSDIMFCDIAEPRTTDRPDGVDMMKCPDVESLDALFNDCSNLILVPFPSNLPVDRVSRFEIVNDTFLFQVTEEFIALKDFLYPNLASELPDRGRIRITGATGCGKSHLIVAMTAYLARRYELEDKGAHWSVFIPSVTQLLEQADPIADIQEALYDAFVNDYSANRDIGAIKSWRDVASFLNERDTISFVLIECNILYQEPLTEDKKGLLQLYSCAVNVIEVFTAHSKLPELAYKGDIKSTD